MSNYTSSSLSSELRFKPAASVVVCRRGGASAAFDRLNKYFTMFNVSEDGHPELESPSRTNFIR
ncbi:MAG: hypothetical protein E7107_10035 [Prevotella sp.]|jgi:hypothetical protein|nr:hypothetical protein [Prevotella sp.]